MMARMVLGTRREKHVGKSTDRALANTLKHDKNKWLRAHATTVAEAMNWWGPAGVPWSEAGV